MSEPTTKSKNSQSSPATPRRGFFSESMGWASGAIMATGLAAGYGTLAAFAGRFLFPSAIKVENWQFVSTVEQWAVGQAMPFQLPSGSKVVVARQKEGSTVDSFVALSSICPHLGCAVHWEAPRDRFFCPCHNGVFDRMGKATEGPPAAASQSLKKFPLKIEKGLLYIAVPADSLAMHGTKGNRHGLPTERHSA